jgi:hypothetical protein
MNEKPIGLIITWSAKMLTEGGASLKSFMQAFESMNEDPDNHFWYQKCRNKPKHDVLYCYIIVSGRIIYRCNVACHTTGPATITLVNGMTRQIDWPRLVLCAPVIKAPTRIEMRGFQGFRYTHEEIF